MRHLLFEDDNFTYPPERTLEIFRALKPKNLGFTWSTPNGVRADKLTFELLQEFKEAGCIELIVGTESGDQDTLDNIVKKELDLNVVLRVAKWCKVVKIHLKSFFIIGFPGETKAKIQNTIDFAVKLHEEYDVFPLLFFATPLLGTELYKTTVEGNFFSKSISAGSLAVATSGTGEGLIETPEFSPKDLLEFAAQLRARVGNNHQVPWPAKTGIEL